jgi:hypothetical protein
LYYKEIYYALREHHAEEVAGDAVSGTLPGAPAATACRVGTRAWYRCRLPERGREVPHAAVYTAMATAACAEARKIALARKLAGHGPELQGLPWQVQEQELPAASISCSWTDLVTATAGNRRAGRRRGGRSPGLGTSAAASA